MIDSFLLSFSQVHANQYVIIPYLSNIIRAVECAGRGFVSHFLCNFETHRKSKHLIDKDLLKE